MMASAPFSSQHQAGGGRGGADLSLQGVNGITNDLNDMALVDRPPPRKIRRRNALTVQDPHYPNVTCPPPNSPTHDSFEDSSRMQALDELIHRRDFFTTDEDAGLGISNTDHHKRKLPLYSHSLNRTNCRNGNNEPKEISKISLHKDLEQYRPQGSLPEALVRKYVKATRSHLANSCSALVPYTPPGEVMAKILGETTANNNVKETMTELDSIAEVDELDEESMDV